MKRVLIITYYFPPSGGAGVQRVLKLVKYLRSFGWEPVVYTADEAAYPILDPSLAGDVPEGVRVLRRKIWEPYDLYKKLIGQKKEEKVYSGFLSENKKPSLAQKLSVWIRGNFFIPDARCFWVRPSIKFLVEELKRNPVDAILSSGPPHTTHLIAKGVNAKLHLPWIADFRDPWTNIDFYHQLMLTKFADRKHRRLEQSVLKQADKVVTVSWHWADDFKKIFPREVEVITNGFDEQDFEDASTEFILTKEGLSMTSAKFVMAHIGSLNGDRNPPALWKALSELCGEDAAFKSDLVIQLVGKNDFSVYKTIEENNLNNNLQRIDYLPHHEVSAVQQRASVLLLLLNNTPNILGIIPGKLFEYLAARRPILVIGSAAGDSARIVNEAGAGVVCEFEEKEKMKNEIRKMYELFGQKKLEVNSKGVEQYSRKKVAERFAGLLNEITTTSS